MMPAYNAERYIAHAIESILAQTYENWKLIVVDDGSKDQTAKIVSRYPDTRINLISQSNGGEAIARNTALANMDGEFIAFLDSDDGFLPDHLEGAIRRLQQQPEIGAVYSDGYHINADGERGSLLSSRRRGPFHGHIFEQVVRASDVFGPPICVVLRRKPVIEHKLLFDDRIVIGPDWDFLTRFSEFALFDYIDHPTCLYRLHSSNISFQTQSSKKALSLALCREKAIQLASFPNCSLATRSYVFYDVLVELLAGFPERQTRLIEGAHFKALPEAERARLFRLMAIPEIRANRNSELVDRWLNMSRRLKANDPRTMGLSFLYLLSPSLCRFILNARGAVREREREETLRSEIGSM